MKVEGKMVVICYRNELSEPLGTPGGKLRGAYFAVFKIVL